MERIAHLLRHEKGSVAYYSFAGLARYPELVHAVSTRQGGVSSGQYATLNLVNTNGDSPAAVSENLRRICGALALEPQHVVSPSQRHTATVRHVGREHRGQVVPDCDILITDEPDVVLLLRFADCTPVLLYDPIHRAIGVVHSGWRGTVLGAARAAVKAMVEAFHSRPVDLIGGIGPSIGPCCYEVGGDVISAVSDAFAEPDGLLPTMASGSRHFDLWQANHRWLAESGVRNIEVAEICTACHRDDFYSYRADRGKTGVFGAIMALRADP